MRIALVHSYYSSRQPSGENVVVDAQAAALSGAGHDVLVVARRTDERERRRTYPIQAAWTVASGRGPDPTEELRQFRPDIVHIHNLFPNFGTRWLAEWPGPVVATLHNFRPMCAAGTLYRDGAECTLCPDGDRIAAVRHGCYRGSRTASVPITISRRGGVAWDPLVRRSDALMVLTEGTREVYRSYGVDGGRLHVIPNFVSDTAANPRSVSGNGRWMFAGRLSPEKGVEELLRVWPSRFQLDVYGSGPLADRLPDLAGTNVRVMGAIERSRIREVMPQYTGLIFPSLWREGLPLVFLEALAAGLPCIAIKGSSVADCLTEHRLGGVLPRSADSAEWEDQLSLVTKGRNALSSRCRAAYEAKYSVDRWITTTEAVYAMASPRIGASQ